MTTEREGRAPLYVRALRLRNLHAGGLGSFVCFERMIAIGVLLALAEVVTWRAVLALPCAVARRALPSAPVSVPASAPTASSPPPDSARPSRATRPDSARQPSPRRLPRRARSRQRVRWSAVRDQILAPVRRRARKPADP